MNRNVVLLLLDGVGALREKPARPEWLLNTSRVAELTDAAAAITRSMGYRRP